MSYQNLWDSPLCWCVPQVKSAASYALGSIAVGNLPEYLPFVLQEITSSKRQYLLLHSLKEIISSASVSGLKPYVELVWSLLLKHSECQEEGTRNVVAECLGKLTLIDPETLLPRLKGYLQSGNQYWSRSHGDQEEHLASAPPSIITFPVCL